MNENTTFMKTVYKRGETLTIYLGPMSDPEASHQVTPDGRFYYGDDTRGDGSITRPFHTLNRALEYAGKFRFERATCKIIMLGMEDGYDANTYFYTSTQALELSTVSEAFAGNGITIVAHDVRIEFRPPASYSSTTYFAGITVASNVLIYGDMFVSMASTLAWENYAYAFVLGAQLAIYGNITIHDFHGGFNGDIPSPFLMMESNSSLHISHARYGILGLGPITLNIRKAARLEFYDVATCICLGHPGAHLSTLGASNNPLTIKVAGSIENCMHDVDGSSAGMIRMFSAIYGATIDGVYMGDESQYYDSTSNKSIVSKDKYDALVGGDNITVDVTEVVDDRMSWKFQSAYGAPSGMGEPDYEHSIKINYVARTFWTPNEPGYLQVSRIGGGTRDTYIVSAAVAANPDALTGTALDTFVKNDPKTFIVNHCIKYEDTWASFDCSLIPIVPGQYIYSNVSITTNGTSGYLFIPFKK